MSLLLSVLLLACVTAFLVGIKIERNRSEARAQASVEPFDLASIIPAHVKMSRPRAYPGETAAEYKTRTGIGIECAQSWVWSDLRARWIEPPAIALVPGTVIDPEEGETVEAYAERREALGFFAPTPHVPFDWRWSTIPRRFVPLGVVAPAVDIPVAASSSPGEDV